MKPVKIVRTIDSGTVVRGTVPKKTWKKIQKHQKDDKPFMKTYSSVFWLEFDLIISSDSIMRALAYPGSTWTEDFDPVDILKEMIL